MNILNQYNSVLIESVQSIGIKAIKTYLDKFYKVSDGTYPIGGEFITKRMIEKTLDGEVIKPSDLLTYLKTKFPKYSDDFIKQVIIDWSNGDISYDYKLTKNIQM